MSTLTGYKEKVEFKFSVETISLFDPGFTPCRVLWARVILNEGRGRGRSEESRPYPHRKHPHYTLGFLAAPVFPSSADPYSLTSMGNS